MAYARLGAIYESHGEDVHAAENVRKAYELRKGVSERERFYIESHYYDIVSHNLEKARPVYELWTQTYPRDSTPRNNPGNLYEELGQYDKSLAEYNEAHRLSPSSAAIYASIVGESYLPLNRLDEARAMAKEAQEKQLDSPGLREALYKLAFLQNDIAGDGGAGGLVGGEAGTGG
jgi:eukaryotic-like serine/threonine-protein kinase